MFSSLLVCRSVSLSLSSPSFWLSPSVPFSLRPLLSLSIHPHPTPTPLFLSSLFPLPSPLFFLLSPPLSLSRDTRRGISGDIICPKLISCAIVFTGAWIAYCLLDNRHVPQYCQIKFPILLQVRVNIEVKDET